jgi:hypothetical protein
VLPEKNSKVARRLGRGSEKEVAVIRPARTKSSPADLLRKHQDIVSLLKKGQSVRNGSKIYGKDFSTVKRVKRIWINTLAPTTLAV